ncbi:MAG: HEPN domain-containing protein [Thermoproteota archaeon]|nr:HEPN domain-containing protein [Candidatus Brockarchaeota archaeon]
MNNYGKARDRLKMSVEDFRRGITRYLEGDYSDAVFRIQLSVEDACKSILSFLGIEFEKTHFPSVIIGKIISDKKMLKKLGLNKEQIKYLTLIISYASSLESQGSMPRYGWETEDRIIMPSEVYTANVARELLRSAIESLKNVIRFFNEFKGLSEDLSEVVEQLKKVVEDASGKIE